MVTNVDEPRLAEWERRLDWPLTALAAVFLVAYAWSVLDTSLTETQRAWLDAMIWSTWAVFAVDYVVRFALARRRWRFVYRHLLDLVVIVLPMFRQLRVLRIIAVLSVLNRQVRGDFRGRVGIYVAGATMLISFAASLAVLDAERQSPDATITTFPDALWWTITTISTVGYGDRYPVTPEGRLVAASLMVAGIALLGVVTGTIASWFVEKMREAEQAADRARQEAVEAERETQAELTEVLDELRALREQVERLQPQRSEPSS